MPVYFPGSGLPGGMKPVGYKTDSDGQDGERLRGVDSLIIGSRRTYSHAVRASSEPFCSENIPVISPAQRCAIRS